MRQTSQQVAYDRIKKLISDNILKPGQHIAEHPIAGMIGMKRGPVRESLIQLHSEGILTRLPHAGFVVRRFDINDVRDLYELREAVESSAASLAALRWSPIQLKDIQEYHEMMDATSKQMPFNIKKSRYCDEMFHRSILAASSNQAFKRIFASLQFYSICLSLSIPHVEYDHIQGKKTLFEHKAILEAIEKRDDKAAGRLMRKHISQTRASILTKIKDKEATVLSNIYGE